ncbi:MAG: hypothetical protein NC324_03200 [Bacteroides sp.]|nr:hypothetical protein [Bacteroides sp.]
MNKEYYCSYELSKKLKAAGFDEPCDHYYFKDDGELKSVNSADNYNVRGQETFTSAPLLYQAQKWLREVNEIDVLIWNCACGYGWGISKASGVSRGTSIKEFDENGNDSDSGMWTTYEAALEAGINAALETIVERRKE